MKIVHLFFGKRTLVLTCVTILFLILATNSACAHAQLVKSNPKDKTKLKMAPAQVELWFNELLDKGFNSIEVISSAELSVKKPTNLAKAEAKVDSKDRTHLTIELPPLKPGDYVIQYRVLSRDGHTASGRLTFQLLAPKG